MAMRIFAAVRALPATAYLAAIYLFILLPVVVLVVFSFQDGNVPAPPLRGLTLRWYEQALSNRRLMSALGNSLVVAFISAVIATALGFLAAYALARYRPHGSRSIQWLLMAPISVSYLIVAMGLLITFNAVGIQSSLLTIIIGHVVINLPITFGIVLSQLGEHQRRLEDAARDLGAAEWQVLFYVTVPLVLPALLAGFCLAATLSWDEFIIALLLSRFEVTLPVEIWSMLRSGLNPETNAAGTLVFAMSVVLVLILESVVFRRRRLHQARPGPGT